MHVTGQCHCGQVRFEAEVDPARVGICHCTDCQVLSGAAYRVTVPTQPGTLRLTGSPKTYVKVADSGARRRHAFCPNCGSPIYATSDEDQPSVFGLRVGALDQRAQLAPRRRIWCRSALPWSQDIGALPTLDKGG
jgi:hypothetical protein